MQDTRVFIYRVDSQDRITFVNAEWYAFAQENGSRALLPETVIGAPLGNFLCNRETRELFENLLHKVRDTGRSVTVPFRCDSPDCRRFMELQLTRLLDRMVEFRSRILRQERRVTMPLLDDTAARSNAMLIMCGWCKKVELPEGRWAEVEEAIDALQLFAAPLLPKISHGVCGGCHNALLQQLAEVG